MEIGIAVDLKGNNASRYENTSMYELPQIQCKSIPNFGYTENGENRNNNL